jgi:hypothetical protein
MPILRMSYCWMTLVIICAIGWWSGWGAVYVVNFVYGATLAAGTVAFFRRQPWPWLALLVAVPDMLIVVGMGYSRQGFALGCALLGGIE